MPLDQKRHGVGDIVRYSPANATSLMRISYVHIMWRGTKFEATRYYGQHYYGGLVGANSSACQDASYSEKEAWYNEGRRKTADGRRLLRAPWDLFLAKYGTAKAVGVE